MEDNANLFRKILDSFSKEGGIDALYVMSEHCDGYRRERAVRELGELGIPSAIPKLIVRANDWVPQIRVAAKEALEKLLIPENAQAFVSSLPSLYHLEKCGRDNHKTLITNAINFLIQPENVGHLKAAIKSDDLSLARIAVNLCIKYSLINKQELVTEILSHKDFVIRNIASNYLCEFSGEVLESFLESSIQDTYMPIRREAFRIYLRVIPKEGLEIAKSFLFDRHMSIREIAIKNLLKNEIDVEQILSSILASGTRSALKMRCAILGLAYIKSERSIPQIKELSSHSLPSIRKATLQALAKLIGDDAKSYIMAGMEDESPSVAKESSGLLNKLGIRLTAEELLGIIKNTNRQHTLMLCIFGTKKINKWERLIFLLGLYALLLSKVGAELEILEQELARWDIGFNKSSSLPSSAQIDCIRFEYSRCREFLSDVRRRSLEFTFKGSGIDV